jgi:4-amino-4-deoxy-L-arabinose transferase-like glycosyltransferase
MEIADSIKPDNSNRFYLPVIIISSFVFFLPNLGLVHLFDWDEINFAESAREMIVSGNYHRVQINFQPFWEKPPLFFWLQVLSMKAFGINEFAARLPNAIFGTITLVTFFFIGKKHKDERFGFIWAIAYLGTFLPHLYFKSGIIDPVFNYFIFLGIYCMYRSILQKGPRAFYFIAVSGIFIGLANLTKGPVGLLVFLITFLIYFISIKFRNFPGIKSILTFMFCFAVISFFWFGQEVMQNGFWFLKEFLTYQANLFLKPVASHGEPFYYHFVVVLIGCFPISILALPVLVGNKYQPSDLRRLMKIMFWTVMILFSITTTKIVHYSSLTYAPLAFIASVYIDHLLEKRKRISTWLLWALGIMGLIFSLLLTGLPIVASHKEWLTPYLKDPFAVAALQIPVYWNGFEFIIGILYFTAIMFSLRIVAKGKTYKGFVCLFYSTAICLFIYLFNVVPKIEAYSQGTAINFYKSIKGQDVYVLPYGFKSYAQYFYFQKQSAVKIGEEEEINYLTKGDINKPAYFIVKITNEQFDTICVNCQLIKTEGGFNFYRREAVKK